MDSKTLAVKILALFTGLSAFQSYALILGVLFVCGIGIPIPEDITLITAGILASQGSISLFGAYISGFIGVMVGDILLFAIGRKYGRKTFSWPLFRRIFTPERVAIAQARVRRNARLICFSARFAPGLRAPIYLTAGVMHVPFKTFLLLDGSAALISVPLWVYLGHLFGSNLEQVLRYAKRLNAAVLITVAVLILGIWLYKKSKTKKELLTPRNTQLKK